MTWPAPTTKYPQGVQLIGGPDHNLIAPFGGTHIIPHYVLTKDGRYLISAAGVYEYRYFTDGMNNGHQYVAVWVPNVQAKGA